MSEGLAERPIPLLTAQEILQLPDTTVLGFHRHVPPFQLTRMDWRNQVILRRRRNSPAPELSTLPALVDIPKHNREQQEHIFIDPDRVYQDAEQTVDGLN